MVEKTEGEHYRVFALAISLRTLNVAEKNYVADKNFASILSRGVVCAECRSEQRSHATEIVL